jgi:hypothetical protein
LLPAFNRAWARAQRQLISANGRSSDFNDRVVRLYFATDEFIGFGNGNRFRNPGQGLELSRRHWAVVAGDPDGRALSARHNVGAEAKALNFFANGRDFRVAGVRAHDD